MRGAAGISQRDLARRVRLTQPRISQIESDRAPNGLPPRTLSDLADALGVDLDALVAGDPRYDLAELDAGPSLPFSHDALPRNEGSVLGRAAETADLARALRGQDRLVTLIGPGGVGKTRLAIHVAHTFEPDFPGGVVFVSLESCADAATMISAIARGVGLRDRDNRPARTRLLTDLDRGRWLLVLDNVEHVLEPVSDLCAELLAAYPELTLLATSRAAMRITGERRFPVPPLRLPAREGAASMAEIASSPAVQIFVQHARAADAGFRLNDANAASVAAICRRLDGLPLAIEIAAARVGVLSPGQLLAHLDRRLEIVASAARGLPARQRSLRASIAWSFALLDAEHQMLLRRLAVFAGGFVLADAAILTGIEDDDPVDGAPESSETGSALLPLADRVAAMLDWHLLIRLDAPAEEPRFGMLETVHEFATEQLAIAGETALLQHRRLVWALSLAEQALPRLFTADEPEWVARLQREHSNLGAALHWAFSEGTDADAEAGLRLAGALADYWYVSGQLSEGDSWLTRAVALATDRPPSIGRARSLVGLCLIEQIRGADALAENHGEESLVMARRLGDWPTVGRACLLLGNVAMMRGDLDRARLLHDEALACFERLDDAPSIAVALIDLGMDDFRQGDWSGAMTRVEAAIEVARSIGDVWDSIVAIRLKADILRAMGRLEPAAAFYAESLALGQRHNSDREIADSLCGVATAALAAGDAERAARLFGAAGRLYHHLGIAMPPPMYPTWTADIATVRSHLERARFERAWEALSGEEAVAEVIAREQTASRRLGDDPARSALSLGQD